VLVDYAHTPDALAQVLAAAREVASGAVLVVFARGAIATARSGPRWAPSRRRSRPRVAHVGQSSERGSRIDRRGRAKRRERRAALAVELDRRAAIAAAIAAARPGDVVVIAGKGHETTQTTGEIVVAFDDRTVAADALRARAAAEGAAWSRS